jgi:hypothetical protein
MSERNLEIDWIGGNCPVQAEGTFDGHAFYFRARGTVVTLDVGDDEWSWTGPQYEWPDAGWISEDTARAFIADAYDEWLHRDKPAHRSLRERKKRNDESAQMMRYIQFAAELERELGEAARPAIDYCMAKAAADLPPSALAASDPKAEEQAP